MHTTRNRRWLTFSLRTFLAVTLVLSLMLGYFGRRWWKAYHDSQPPTLQELAQIARRHGVPMPPKDAKLVLAQPEWHPSKSGGPTYCPCFLLSEQRNGERIVLHGSKKTVLFATTGRNQRWRPFSADPRIAKSARFEVDWSSSAALLCAVQLADRGDYERAAAIFERIKDQVLPLSDCPLPVVDGRFPDLREFVRYWAFSHLEERLTEEPEAWAQIREQMEVLLKESPALRREKAILVRDFSATVDAPAAKAGTAEALLLEWSLAESTISHPSAQAIARRGFEAVPDLIRLRDDRRLTAHLLFQGIDERREFQRLGELADELLREISGVGRGDRISVAMPDELRELDSIAWDNWWQQAEPFGERQYCIANLIKDGLEIRQHMVRVLASKYPETLPRLGREYFQASPQQIARPQLATILARGEAPWPGKIAMLTDLAQDGSVDDRRGVLRVLSFYDAGVSEEPLIELFNKIAAEDLEIEIPSPNESFPQLVVELNNPRVTKVYLNAARRSLPLRMELLSRAAYSDSAESRLPLRLALLAAFLEDESLRDISGKFERLFSDAFTQISVRDFASVQLARVLNMDVQPQPDWTPEQWSALRDQVRERLKDEMLPELE